MLIKQSQVGVLQRPSFLTEGLRLPKKLGLRRTPLTKKKYVAIFATMPFFHPPEESWSWCKPRLVKNPCCSQSYCSIKDKFPSLFENVVLRSLKTFFIWSKKVNNSLYHNPPLQRISQLKPSKCTFNPINLFGFPNFENSIISFP